jgi:hypothetical protein
MARGWAAVSRRSAPAGASVTAIFGSACTSKGAATNEQVPRESVLRRERYPIPVPGAGGPGTRTARGELWPLAPLDARHARRAYPLAPLVTLHHECALMHLVTPPWHAGARTRVPTRSSSLRLVPSTSPSGTPSRSPQPADRDGVPLKAGCDLGCRAQQLWAKTDRARAALRAGSTAQLIWPVAGSLSAVKTQVCCWPAHWTVASVVTRLEAL